MFTIVVQGLVKTICFVIALLKLNTPSGSTNFLAYPKTRGWLAFSPSNAHISHMLRYIKEKHGHTSCLMEKFIFYLWSIWKSRNDHNFQETTFLGLTTFFRDEYLFLDWKYRFDPDKTPTGHNPLAPLPPNPPSSPNTFAVQWSKPEPPCLKLNFDGPVINGRAIAGFVI